MTGSTPSDPISISSFKEALSSLKEETLLLQELVGELRGRLDPVLDTRPTPTEPPSLRTEGSSHVANEVLDILRVVQGSREDLADLFHSIDL